MEDFPARRTHTLKDACTDATVEVTIEANEQGINIGFAGYGDHGSADGLGRPVFIELNGSELSIHVWTDINEEDPTHVLRLKSARESQRLAGDS